MKPTLYLLHEGFYEGVAERLAQLRHAAATLDAEVVVLDSLGCDYSRLPKLTRHDLLYNCARGSYTLESLLLDDVVTTFYVNTPSLSLVTSTTDSSILHAKAGIRAPRTVFAISADRALLRSYVDHVGGFPVVVKVAGGTRGIGTMKVESWPSFVSTVDYLLTTRDRFIVREFIPTREVGRCRVLGDRVIQSYLAPVIEGDFRTAIGPLDSLAPVRPVRFSDEIERLCVNAAWIANTECAAVDFIVGEDGLAYLLEVNMPAGLPLNWRERENDIALQTVSYLLRKAERNA